MNEFKNAIEAGLYLTDPTKISPDVMVVVRCGKCKYFMPKHILLDDGTRRLYTEEEKSCRLELRAMLVLTVVRVAYAV